MSASVLGVIGAVKEMPRQVDQDELPRLLGRAREGAARARKFDQLQRVAWEKFMPDFNLKLGTGAYGGVYPVQGSPHQVVKVFSHSDWDDVMRESRFAQTMKARYPQHFVDCLGVGTDAKDGQPFAVFERAEGITLNSAAHRFHSPDGITHVTQALDVLDQLLTVMIGMTKPDGEGQLHFHLDLKPDNIMVRTDGGSRDVEVKLIDYGIVRTCGADDKQGQEDSEQQLFRWFGWELLWALSSEAFRVDSEQNPWEQLPEGFRPFFQRSDFRPAAYRSEQLTPGLLKDALQDGFFDQVMSPAFRQQWQAPAQAKKCLGTILGDLFHGVALASDRAGPAPNFDKLRSEIRELRVLASE
ncbi:unnamed protein product [Effrenium voratum]|nr:unnamed protein product [Effrenium voratum]